MGIGETHCIAGTFEKIGDSCESNSDCGVDYVTGENGECAGVKLNDEQKFSIGGGWREGINKLKKLFAKPIQIWKWENIIDPDTNKSVAQYVDFEEAYDYWDEVNTSEQEKYRPTINNIKINGQSIDSENPFVKIENFSGVVLNFNSYVDFNHLPLVAYRVDWGDETLMSTLSQLKFYPRINEDKPHSLLHVYECRAGSEGYYSNCPDKYDVDGACCIYEPKIQIEDNWGWCSNGVVGNKCPNDSINTPWVSGGKVIIKN
jgi:hypothetical protein